MKKNNSEKKIEKPVTRIIETKTPKEILKKYSKYSGKSYVSHEDYVKYYMWD